MKARTFGLTKRLDVWSAHSSVGGPSDHPQQAKRPAATSPPTRERGRSAAPAPAATASRSIGSEDRRRTGNGR